MLISELKSDQKYHVVMDVKQWRPGCAIIQAMYGCNNMIASLFDTNLWLLAPTDDMVVIPFTGDTLKEHVEMLNRGEKPSQEWLDQIYQKIQEMKKAYSKSR